MIPHVITTLILHSLINGGGTPVSLHIPIVESRSVEEMELPFDGSGEKIQRRTISASAYTSRKEETDEEPCISASGDSICELFSRGERTVATNNLKFGTKVYALGEVWTVRDRMNRRYTGKGYMDFYFGEDVKEAREFGRRSVEIIIEK